MRTINHVAVSIVTSAILALTIGSAAEEIPSRYKSHFYRTHGPRSLTTTTTTHLRLGSRSISSNTLFSDLSIIAPLSIGTPAQELYVLLDTSSADLCLFTEDYLSQYHPASSSSSIGPAYDSSSSSTYVSSSNTFTNSYGSGSTLTSFQAAIGRETMTLEQYMLANQTFGLMQNGNVSYGPLASGILGLAFESASVGMQAVPPVQQLYFDGALKSPLFSFAIMRPSVESELAANMKVTEPGGIFTLGQLDSDQYSGPIGWSPLVTPSASSSSPTKWLAALDSIAVNGVVVDQTKGMIANFDTGSSATRASQAMLNAIFTNVKGALTSADGSFYLPCGTTIAPAMNLTISMGGTSVPIEPLDLLYKTTPYNYNGQTYCLSTMTPTTSTQYDIQIGDDFLRSLFVAFQYSPPRVGLAAQSTNVHNQGAKPGYALGPPQALPAASLSSPSVSNSISHVVVQSVPSTATDSLSTVSVNGGAYTIQQGGTFVGISTAQMRSITASSTPTPIAPVNTASSATSHSSSSSSGASSAASSSSAGVSSPLNVSMLIIICILPILFLSTPSTC